MSSTAGAPFEFLPLGAIIQTFLVGKQNLNIVQNFPTADWYKKYRDPHFGETIGRIANRVSGAKINSLNGKSYPLAPNDPPNSLHGGNIGWGMKVWEGPRHIQGKTIPGVEGLEDRKSLEFKMQSADGDEGYPGTVEARVVYTTGTQMVDGKEVRVLAMEYTVEFVGPDNGVQETAVNVTNHSYFNLSGQPTIAGTQVSLSTNEYLPIDKYGIPLSTSTGTYDGITANTPFTLTATAPEVDNCFVFPSSTFSIDTRTSPLRSLAKAYHPDTKIHLEVLSTDPSFQFYTGQHIDVPAFTHEGKEYEKRISRSGFCVEPSRYINAVNMEEWRGQVVLKRGETYGSRIVFRGWSDE